MTANPPEINTLEPRSSSRRCVSAYFLHHRELLGGLARAAWETVLELMRAADGEEGMRPGMVAVVQTAGDLANWHPHVHALVSKGKGAGHRSADL